MGTVYLTNITNPLLIESFDNLLSNTPIYLQMQINRYYRLQDKYRKLVGYILLSYIVSNDLNNNLGNIQLERNEWGKPFIKNMPHYNFNISHSGNWVVCAIDKYQVGIDIEQIIPIQSAEIFSIAEQYFSPKENDFLKYDPHGIVNNFYTIWTAKESFIKAIGKGLSYPLNIFSVIPNNTFLKFQNNLFITKQIPCDDTHMLSICYDHNSATPNQIFVDIKDLLNYNKYKKGILYEQD